MKVTIKEYTERPLDQIAEHAGTSYGRTDASEKRVKHCWERGHLSVFEAANVRFVVEGISRACSHQLVRHRLFSVCQESQRYTTVKGDDWYVIPPAFERENIGWYSAAMNDYKGWYEMALADGIKPEDARYLLPEATKTKLSIATNVRELFHFFNLRCDKAAQWEIRDLANEIKEQCKGINDQWKTLIGLWEDKTKTRKEAVEKIVEWFGCDKGDPELIKDAKRYVESVLRQVD